MNHERLVFGAFVFDLRTLKLTCDGERIDLRPQVARALAYLLARPGEDISRASLRDHLWAPGTYVDHDAGLNTCMRRLRKALGDDSRDARYVLTVRGRGYRFVAPVTKQSAGGPSPVPAPPPVDLTTSIPRLMERRAQQAYDRRRVRDRIGWCGAAVIVVTMVVLAARGGRFSPHGLSEGDSPPAPLRAPRTVLLGTLGALDEDLATVEAFRVALAQSGRVRLVSEQQVRAAFARMMTPVSQTIDRTRGLEICEREGIGPLVLSRGSAYRRCRGCGDGGGGRTQWHHRSDAQ